MNAGGWVRKWVDHFTRYSRFLFLPALLPNKLVLDAIYSWRERQRCNAECKSKTPMPLAAERELHHAPFIIFALVQSVPVAQQHQFLEYPPCKREQTRTCRMRQGKNGELALPSRCWEKAPWRPQCCISLAANLSSSHRYSNSSIMLHFQALIEQNNQRPLTKLRRKRNPTESPSVLSYPPIVRQVMMEELAHVERKLGLQQVTKSFPPSVLIHTHLAWRLVHCQIDWSSWNGIIKEHGQEYKTARGLASRKVPTTKMG